MLTEEVLTSLCGHIILGFSIESLLVCIALSSVYLIIKHAYFVHAVMHYVMLFFVLT